jgi:hypothetical protein
MHRLLLAFLITIAFCGSINAQQETISPIKNKSNRIILHFQDTLGVFTKLKKILTDRNYDLEINDRETGIIKTKNRNLPGGWSHSVQIRFLMRDSTVTISAKQPDDFSFDIFYMTSRSTFRETWKELMLLASELHPARISYLAVIGE